MNAEDTQYLVAVRGIPKIHVIDRKAKKIIDLKFMNPSYDANIEAIKVVAMDESSHARLAIIRDRSWISVLDLK